MSATTTEAAPSPAAMSHPAVMRALSGLLMGMFVSILAGTVVSTSMPRIISDLGGNQAAFTWVITSTLLATTVSTPIWGKFADITNRKLLIQIALVIFVLGSALAGFSQNTETLIIFRVMQGLGGGGLAALSQIIMADIISPRERGRYMGLFGAVMAVGTVGGPLLGGVITDAIGWRWNFFVALPFAIAAIFLLQRNLNLPALEKIKVKIDYLGMILIAGGISLLLIWVTLAGHDFDWDSTTSFVMVGGAILMLILAVIVEVKVENPIIPMSLFKNPTFSLAVIASISVGVAMFGTSVFLGQYMQLARGATPTQSGLLTLPMIGGLLLSSTFVGMLISKFGKWKGYMVFGSIALTVGMFLMGTIKYDTNYVVVSIYMFILGVGVGMVMQNLVLIVQNTVSPKEIGVASSGVTFFRSLGGTIGISVLGSVLATKIADGITAKAADIQAALVHLGPAGAEVGKQLQSGVLPKVAEMPDGIRVIIESVYGQGVADIFLLAAPLALITVLAIVFLPNRSLSTQTATERLKNGEDAQSAAGAEAAAAGENLIAVGEASIGAQGDLVATTGTISTLNPDGTRRSDADN
ncbi:MDR family MFS transporter [Mycetocola saprophilus]|uniref:MDR family MFS transporter n=1 Tax=Mycetocola saprophilus TaxID=76636 RepID=UPI001FDF0A93|nr:MDR family MFS transporter [Mycetocola saprophilus]